MANIAVGIARAFGYMTEDEVKSLSLACEMLREGWVKGVNIGAGAGTSGLVMYTSRDDITVYTVDVSSGGPLGGLEGERNAFIESGVDSGRLVQILGDSGEVGKGWGNGEVDIVFIDDGHLEEDVRRDIAAWMPWIKKGGMIAFHDYGSPRWPDVKRVVDEMMLGKKLLISVDTLVVYEV